jgi:hypothetical protein
MAQDAGASQWQKRWRVATGDEAAGSACVSRRISRGYRLTAFGFRLKSPWL